MPDRKQTNERKRPCKETSKDTKTERKKRGVRNKESVIRKRPQGDRERDACKERERYRER